MLAGVVWVGNEVQGSGLRCGVRCGGVERCVGVLGSCHQTCVKEFATRITQKARLRKTTKKTKAKQPQNKCDQPENTRPLRPPGGSAAWLGQWRPPAAAAAAHRGPAPAAVVAGAAAPRRERRPARLARRGRLRRGSVGPRRPAGEASCATLPRPRLPPPPWHRPKNEEGSDSLPPPSLNFAQRAPGSWLGHF